MQIVVLDGYTLNPGDLSWESLGELGELTVYERTPAEMTVSRIGTAEAVLTNKTLIDSSVMASCPDLKYIGVLATGYNVVDIEAAKERGITVTNIPAYSTAAVAQFTIALLLELCHRIGAHSDSVHAGDWSESENFSYWKYPLIELEGKTFGIIGYGRIGRAVAPVARALGMHVLVATRTPPEHDTDDREVRHVSFEQLMNESDIISLHCPLTPETDKLINRKTLALAKAGVMIINTGRGGLIDAAALAEALRSGKVAAAAVDVLAQEPPLADDPLLDAPNCIITPHIAWAPKQTRSRLMNIAAGNLASWLADEPVNEVN